MSELRNKAKKDGKNVKESVGNVNKGSTFAPATAKAYRNTGRKGESDGKKFSKKKIRKSLRDLKMLSTFAPRKTRKVHWETGRKIREKGLKKISKKTLNFSCRKQKEVLVLHPL